MADEYEDPDGLIERGVDVKDRSPSMIRILRGAEHDTVTVGWLVHEAVVRGRADDHDEARDTYEVLKKKGELYEPTSGMVRSV